jgi:hypothetical protein
MIDASIPLQVRPPQIAGPMDMAANALAIQGGVHKNALNQLQMQQAQRQMADDQGLREVLSSPDLQMDQAPNALLRRGLYKPAMEMEKALLEKRKSLASIGKDEAETNLKHLGVLSGIMAGAKTPEDFANGLKTAQAAGVPSQLIQQFAANAPQNALQIPSYAQNIAAITKQGIDAMKFRLGDFKDTGGALVDMNPYSPTFQQAMPKTATPGEVLTDTRGREQLTETQRHNRQAEANTVRGQNMTDSRTREQIAAGRVPAGYRANPDGTLSAIPGGPAEALTTTQKDELTSIERTRSSAAQLKKMFKPEFVGFKGTMGEFWDQYGSQVIPGAQGDSERIQFRALAADTENQYIKAISGATVPTSEVPRLRRAIPVPSDSPARYEAKLKEMERNLTELPAIIRNGPKSGAKSGASGAWKIEEVK